MAAPTEFPEQTAVLGAPPGCADEVLPLPVLHREGHFISCWKVTPEEIAEIARTGVLWLAVWGPRTQPPVLVTGHREHVLG